MQFHPHPTVAHLLHQETISMAQFTVAYNATTHKLGGRWRKYPLAAGDCLNFAR